MKEEAHDYASPFADYTKRAEAFAQGQKLIKPVSGKGSAYKTMKPFIAFLVHWLQSHSWIHSIVEASCGHWPSGWQQHVEWPPLIYTGIDILPSMIEANLKMPRSNRLKNQTFMVMDMMHHVLPAADLLLTKDTLIHLPNRGIRKFLQLNVNVCPPRYRYVMFVHDRSDLVTSSLPDCRPYLEQAHACVWRNNKDISLGSFHTLDVGEAPFKLSVETIFTFGHSKTGRQRVVQLLNLSKSCHR